MAQIFYNPSADLVTFSKVGKNFYYLIFLRDLPKDQCYAILHDSDQLSMGQLLPLCLPQTLITFDGSSGNLRFLKSDGRDVPANLRDHLIAISKHKTYAITAFSPYLSDEIFGLFCAGVVLETAKKLENKTVWEKLQGITLTSKQGRHLYFATCNIEKKKREAILLEFIEETVHSDIGGGKAARAVAADSQPRIRLLPAGEGLKVAVLTRPFGAADPYFQPGKGEETVIAKIDGERVQTMRDLALEKKLAQTAIDSCPTLISFEEKNGEWRLENPEDCLDLLLELRELRLSDSVVVEWPEGEKWRVTRQVRLQDLHLNIHSQRDWFAVSGELHLDEKSVLSIQELMKLLEGTPGRFIPLDDGQFLALTEAFRERLEEMRTFSEKSGDGLRFHPFAAPILSELSEEVGQLKADKHWREHLQRFQESQDFTPEVPSTLHAELRDYQLEGFRWLARLARWGAGACLADDMGLGKTLQALAVILTRAPEGPTLAIAPTSVCLNWISEAEKFAPTLNIVHL
jgi:hypothetical protein